MTYDNTGLTLLTQGVGGTGKHWLYSSTDAKETVDGAGYISDGQDFGMAAGDLVFIYDEGTPEMLTSIVASLSTANKSVDLKNTTVVGSTADSD